MKWVSLHADGFTSASWIVAGSSHEFPWHFLKADFARLFSIWVPPLNNFNTYHYIPGSVIELLSVIWARNLVRRFNLQTACWHSQHSCHGLNMTECKWLKCGAVHESFIIISSSWKGWPLWVQWAVRFTIPQMSQPSSDGVEFPGGSFLCANTLSTCSFSLELWCSSPHRSHIDPSWPIPIFIPSTPARMSISQQSATMCHLKIPELRFASLSQFPSTQSLSPLARHPLPASSSTPTGPTGPTGHPGWRTFSAFGLSQQRANVSPLSVCTEVAGSLGLQAKSSPMGRSFMIRDNYR